MATRAQVLSTTNLSEGAASGPFTLHVAQNELSSLNAGVVVFIVTKGSFELVLPAERKFVPLAAEFDSTKTCWIKGVEAENEAIVFEKASILAEEKKATKPAPDHSNEDSETVVSREEPKRKVVYQVPEGSKRLRTEPDLLEDNVITDKDWARVLTKANEELKGATLIVQMPNCAEYSAVIDHVAVNSLNNMCLMVKESESAIPTRAMIWLRSKVGSIIKESSSDQVWWGFAWLKTRTGRMRLDHAVPWALKTRKDKMFVQWFLETTMFNALEIAV